MVSDRALGDFEELQRRGYQYLLEKQYKQAINFYETLINDRPEIHSNYWYLGLSLLLAEQVSEAHTTWLVGMMEADAAQIEKWTQEILEILEFEARQREETKEYRAVWLIRQQIREINPNDLNNLLALVQATLEQEQLTGDELEEWGVIDLTKAISIDDLSELNTNLLTDTLNKLLEYIPSHPAVFQLAEISLSLLPNPNPLVQVLFTTSLDLAYTQHRPDIAIKFAELCLIVDRSNLEILRALAAFCEKAGRYVQGIQTAQLCFELTDRLADKVFVTYLVIKCLMSAGGANPETLSFFEKQQDLLREWFNSNQENMNSSLTLELVNSFYFAPYIQDNPKINRVIQNKISDFCQKRILIDSQNHSTNFQEKHLQRKFYYNNPPQSKKVLKIGYLSACFKEHSVGWLARWLFHHHDRQRFYIVGYFTNKDYQNTPLEKWYLNHVAEAHYTIDKFKMAEQIAKDKIDILVDLDSITLDISCGIMAQKPAPVQATWLGWDASGIPAIDYFIADPYVLPESAQDYYSETIWRLPQTYIAVDGFEIGVPTLRRDLLGVPNDAVIYYSAQRGYKRHPHTARLQMKILKEVPNSYFLIKGLADPQLIKTFFIQLAEEEGVSCDRLVFVPRDSAEAIHRANLGIADVVLDTYPYNGATTTLETLWMGVPLVTRVGEQFAARNSYTMMVNAGITEGIAWNDEEYVEWGVRLGKDPALRKDISWRLLRSRQTAPLWNAEKFTRNMEQAYEQMWDIFLQK
ncbi:O-linked N-acetylglucosamine transferase, SPINDLY family protein [Oxynema aestuarii]|uniref:O-linked N-acetylglucosamine transferase, SPINDLY family protein n=1 Tax=Oxynema aestuarii AP17 TaxID=2064643 RepID=A0A6H1U018_9CYAN|nr:O-linked N-acetylglucosamine transferase, SPINDLY family protein [Oxynema aestuarii]QIZ71786.1 O-linked N-acetylglucosamine transferase, SPINDLY family protein [Oxynema aestuarii AP17]